MGLPDSVPTEGPSLISNVPFSAHHHRTCRSAYGGSVDKLAESGFPSALSLYHRGLFSTPVIPGSSTPTSNRESLERVICFNAGLEIFRLAIIYCSALPSCRRHIRQISPGKNDSFHPMYPLHLLYGVRVVLDFVLCGKLVHPKSALYVVLVHQVGTLPSASFGFHLMIDTLAIS